MIDEEKVKKAVGEFCKNPYFKKMYVAAPTEISGRHTALSFFYIEYASELKAEGGKMDEYKKREGGAGGEDGPCGLEVSSEILPQPPFETCLQKESGGDRK